jgi:acetolactate decarboxylase
LKKRWFIIASLALVTLISSYGFSTLWSTQQNNNRADRDTLFQIEAFNTFSTGKYDGYMPYSELAEHGDFGIGTFHELDGEMIALNGIFYQIPIDGKPKQVDPTIKAPYATVTFFEADITKTLENSVNYLEIQNIIRSLMPTENAIYGIKISGTYIYAETRSVPAQTKPYPTIAEVVENQSIFFLNNVSGTAVGFWFPSSMDGVDYAGYHFHLITDDNSAGGHLLDFIVENATIEIDQTNSFNLILP